MKKFFAEKLDNKMNISGEELLHLAVLRCKVGEKIICYTQDIYEYFCTITEISKKHALASIDDMKLCEANPTCNLTVFQALPKGDKMELITQKLTELGASKIIPFESEFTVAKTNNNKNERMNKIAKEACKQCGRSISLVVEDTISFKEMIDSLKEYDTVIFANEKNKFANCDIIKSNKIALIVGSEGGFSDKEIDIIEKAGAISFGLGSRILRCETAVISLTAIICHLLNI